MGSFSPTLFAGRRFAVVGLGAAGLASAQALVGMGAEVLAWDDRAVAREACPVALRDPVGAEYEALVLSPGIAHRLPVPHRAAADAVARGIPVWTDAELLFQAVRASGSRARFAGITGTNGKSTTTALLAHMLRGAGVACAAGANLGPAALSLPLLGDAGVYVLEMSSYMLERLATLRFDVAAMLNLSPDHLDRHGSMDGYAAAKRAIFDRQTAEDVAVVGVDDGRSVAMAAGLGARAVRVSGHRRAEFWADGTVLRQGGAAVFDLREAPALPGTHNAQNAAAAAAMAVGLGLSAETMARGLASFPGLPHRQEQVALVDGVTYVNDSKATNAEAAACALGCHGRVIWIAGGMAKDGGIEGLAPWFGRIAEALLIGRDAAVFAATLAAHGVPHRVVGTLEAAMREAPAAARYRAVPVVLLSPAAASWDQFTGFEQRGARFAELARSLGTQSLDTRSAAA